MDKKTFSPLLEGSRIVLKKFEEDLASTMFSYIEKDRDRLGKFLPWVSFIKKVEDEINFIKQAHKLWDEKSRFGYGIFRKEDGVYMGNIGIHSILWDSGCCEVGYWILGDFEGQGYMSEALRILEAHAFDVGFHRIEVRCSSINQRSASVPIACGYFYDGVLKENAIEYDKYRQTSIFSKLVQHYKKPNIQETTEKDITSVIAIAKKLPQFFTVKGIENMSVDFYSQKGFVYRNDDKVVGFINYFSNQGVAEIGWMGVLPEFQKKNIGTQLFNRLKKELKNNNCSALVVKTLDESVDYKPYEQTRKFYLKNSFKKSHVIQHPDNPECEAELVLKMDLSYE